MAMFPPFLNYLRVKPLAEARLLRGRARGALYYAGNFLGMGDEYAVAGAGDFGGVAVGALGVPALQVRVDGAVASGYYHPARFGSPGRGGDRSGKIWSIVEDLRARHERGLIGGQVGREQFMKARRVDVGETVRRGLGGSGFGQVAGEALAVFGFFLAGIGHVRRDIDQADDGWNRAGFSDNRAAIAGL